MIDLVYRTLLTIINKENQGYVSPMEFNILANQVQQEIYREYFEDENRDKNKENRGLINNGYSNLSFNQRQRVQQFAEITTVTRQNDRFTLPSNLYFIEDNGVISTTSTNNFDTVVSEVERNQYNYLIKSSARPTELFPIYEKYNGYINIFPATITGIQLRYVRKPNVPNWTYMNLTTGDPVFNMSDPLFRDFDLHESEFSNIVLRMLSYSGINLREPQVIQVAETLKNKMNLKDNA